MMNNADKVKNFSDRIIYKMMFKWSVKNAMDLCSIAELVELCCRSREMIWSEPILLRLKSPICVIGDIHGQFEDLIGMFDMNGWPLTTAEIDQLKKTAFRPVSHSLPVAKTSERSNENFKDQGTRYLFLGDYVDRGTYSIEVVTLLLALKLSHPDRVFMLRGNHESRPVNCHYGFYKEVSKRYNTELYECFQNLFNVLPFSAVINDSIMCMHGGISSYLKSFDQFNNLKRPCEIPDVGILTDLTWADPDPNVQTYEASPRGASYTFGCLALRKFLSQLNIQLIVRAHQVVQDGYEFFDDRRLVTIFSAPNYCGDHDNSAAILVVSAKMELKFKIFRPISRNKKRQSNSNSKT